MCLTFYFQSGPLGKRGSQNGKRNPNASMSGKSPMVIELGIPENVELHTTENAWKPQPLSKKRENGGNDENASEELAKKVRAILNKLTPQKFDTLMKRFDDLTVDTEDKLRMCIKLIFEKVSKSSLCVLYNNYLHLDFHPSGCGRAWLFRGLCQNVPRL